MGCCADDKKKCCGIGFHNIPAALGDDTGEFKPENGAYHNMLVKYEENGALYLYVNDGSWVKIEEPANDATLTIKQGDTTLGTFSANASEDVEIDIPEGGGDTATYTITANNLRADSSFASRNWTLDSAASVFAMCSSSVTVTKDGAEVGASDLASSGNSLLESVFVFDLLATYPDPNAHDRVIEKPVQVSAKPTSITSDDNGLVISGVYSLDGLLLDGLPGSLVIPPLRFSLAVSTEEGQADLTFHAETVVTFL